jgi:hypothetical protein
MLQVTTIVFLISFSLLAVLHSIATKLYLYWHIWWLDMPMHAFGGAIVALGLYTLRDLRIIPNGFLRFLPVMGTLLLIALSWEAFELIVGTPVIGNYLTDTLSDLACGLCGGAVGFFIGKKLRELN